MTPKLTDAKYKQDYKIWLKFSDGTEGEIDLKNELSGDLLGALKDASKFRAFKLDTAMNTLVWPNGADLSPEFLYKKLRPSDDSLEATANIS